MTTKSLTFTMLLGCLSCGGSGDRNLELLSDQGAADPGEQERLARMNITVDIGGESRVFTARTLAQDILLQECIDAQILPLQASESGVFRPIFLRKSGFLTWGQFCDDVGDVILDPSKPTATSGPPAFKLTPLDVPANSDCMIAVCQMDETMCVAHRLLEISEAAAPVTLSVMLPSATAAVKVVIPPPDEETSISLAEEAFHYAAWATTVAGDSLRSAAATTAKPSAYDGWCTSDGLSQMIAASDGSEQTRRTVGEHLADTLAEGLLVAQEAAGYAVQHHTGVADAETSRTADVKLAARRAWLDKNMSRARAAHLLVGGELDSGYAGEPVCALEPPDMKTRRAIDILRAAALAPATVKAIKTPFVPMSDVWTTDYSGDKSMRFRLKERTGDPAYLDMTWAEFLARSELTETAFVAAREYLIGELAAFERDQNATLPKRATASSLVDGEILSYENTAPIYGATALSPRPMPAVSLLAKTRYAGLPVACRDDSGGVGMKKYNCTPTWTAMNDVDGVDVVHGGDIVAAATAPGAVYARKGAGQLEDYVRSVTYDLAAPPSGSLLPGATKTRLQEIESAHGAGGGRVEACYLHDASGTTVRLQVIADGVAEDYAKYRVFTSLSDLRCALDGTVEGAKCVLPEDKTVVEPRRLPDPVAGASHAAQLVLHPPVEVTWLYVARQRGTSDAPGQFEAVAGLRIVHTVDVSDDYLYCTWMPVSATLNNAVTSVLGADTSDCTHAAASCTGAGFAETLPLENELTTDGDAYESSWRVYLERAKAAAAEADQLGEALISQGLEQDTRIEAAEREIEDLCGVAVSFSAFSPDGAVPLLDAACTPEQDGQSCGTTGYCRNGACIKDPLKAMTAASGTDSLAAAVAECLGTDDTIPLVVVGSDPVCIWQNDETKKVCEEIPNVGHACPWLPDANGDCKAPADTATLAGYTIEEVGDVEAERLNLLTVDAAPLPVAPINCDYIAELRSSVGEPRRGELIAELAPTLGVSRMQEIARRVGWEARPGDFSAVTLDGVDILSTGNPLVGTCPLAGMPAPQDSTTWPCKIMTHPPASGASLFRRMLPLDACSVLNPGLVSADGAMNTSREQRIEMNNRLGEAVLALKVLTGTDFGAEFQQPYRHWDAACVASMPPGVTQGCLDGLPLTVHNGLVVYDENWSTDTGNASGLLVCQASSTPDDPPPMWTRMDGPGEYTTFPYECGAGTACGTGATAGVTIPVTFWQASLIAGNQAHVARVWGGLGGSDVFSKAGASPDVLNDFILWALFDGPDAASLPRAVGDRLSHYWVDNETSNGIELSPLGLSSSAVFDALEIACYADRSVQDCDPDRPPPVVNDVQDLLVAEGYLTCMANRLLERSRHTVLRDMPKDAIRGLTNSVDVSGEMGAEAAELASALKDLDKEKRAISLELASLGYEVGALARQMKRIENEQHRVALSASIQEWNLIGGCLGTAAQAAALFVAAPGAGIAEGATGVVGGGGVGGAASCVTGWATQGLQSALDDLTYEDLALQSDDAWARMRTQILAHATAVQDAAATTDSALLRVQASLARRRARQAEGARSLSNAMMLGGDSGGRTFSLNTAMRRRYNTLQIRYERALAKARRAAWLARRAVEQRLAINLDAMHRDMLMVEAPSQWASSVCTMKGLDYAAIRDTTNPDLVVDNYADQYIGDYVDRLDRVVQSYEHDFPFSDGQDTAVISLRDDVLGVRVPGPVSVPNLLAHSSYLDMAEDADGLIWETVCTNAIECTAPDGGVGCSGIDGGIEKCPIVVGESSGGAEGMPPFELTFTEEGQALRQVVSLPPGYYRLSWFSPDFNPALVTVDLRQSGVDTLDASPVNDVTMMGWPRHYQIFQVASETVPVEVTVGAEAPATIHLAGMMLEDIDDEIIGTPELASLTGYLPQPYAATTEAGLGVGPRADSTGIKFRELWRRGREQLCATGFGICSGGAIQPYRELNLSFTVEGIESGGMLSHSGFAYGNFNYRIDWIAVNLVGTGIKDCSTSATPETCYASLNIPFTLTHDGPFEVRNYDGEIYQAPLFDGRIEHGRALAAERYITNPISSADMSMLEPYIHAELRGRPIAGRYALRLWDTDGINWNAVEDVQLVLGYRYWTRFE